MKYGLKKFLVATLVALIASPASAQMSSFDQSKSLMTLQLVKAGGQYFSKMALFLPSPPDLWQLQSKGAAVNPLKASDAAIYSATDGTLQVPVLKIDSTVYANVKFKLPNNGNWTLLDQGDVMSTTSPGYELSYPITGKMPNIYCTDAGGELSYLINVAGSTKPQVWKHVADEPCCPLSVTTNSTANIAGISDVQIYPNPGEGATTGNFRMMVTFTGKVSSPTTTQTCGKTVPNSVYAGNCIATAGGTCVPDIYESCVVIVPTSVYAGTCNRTAPGICSPESGTVDVYSCIKNVPDSVYSGACFSPVDGICNATTGSADNGFCSGIVVKKNDFCRSIDNTPYCAFASTTTDVLVDQTGVETCVIRPVLDVLNYPVGSNKAPLAVSDAGPLEVIMGERRTIYVSGGLPPYFVTASRPGVLGYELLEGDATGVGQALVIQPKTTGTTQLSIFDYNGSVIPISVKSAGIPLLISPSTIDVPEGTLIDVRIEGGIPPLTVFNPAPDWVEAPATVVSTPTTIRIAMKKSSGSSKTFLVFTDAVGTQAGITEIKISASTEGTTVVPASLNLKVGDSSIIYVTGGNAPISILNTRPDLMNIPESLAKTPGTVTVTAKKGTDGQAIPIFFTDVYGIRNTVNVTITSTPIFK